LPSRNIAKVFSRVLVRKCGNFLIPRMTKMQSARVQIMLERPILRVDTPYPAECGVSVVCLGSGLPQPSYGTMILIFTNKEDAHPNPVIDILTERGVPFFRLNTEALGFLRYLDEVPSIGSILNDRYASSKMVQSQVAIDCGFTIPHTLSTNRKTLFRSGISIPGSCRSCPAGAGGRRGNVCSSVKRRG